MIDKLIFGIPAVAYPSLSVRNSPLFGEYETTRGVWIKKFLLPGFKPRTVKFVWPGQVLLLLLLFLLQEIKRDRNGERQERDRNRWTATSTVSRHALPCSIVFWTWSQRFHLKCSCISTRLCGVTSRRTVILILNTTRNKCDIEWTIHWKEETGAENKNHPFLPPAPFWKPIRMLILVSTPTGVKLSWLQTA